MSSLRLALKLSMEASGSGSGSASASGSGPVGSTLSNVGPSSSSSSSSSLSTGVPANNSGTGHKEKEGLASKNDGSDDNSKPKRKRTMSLDGRDIQAVHETVTASTGPSKKPHVGSDRDERVNNRSAGVQEQQQSVRNGKPPSASTGKNIAAYYRMIQDILCRCMHDDWFISVGTGAKKIATNKLASKALPSGAGSKSAEKNGGRKRSGSLSAAEGEIETSAEAVDEVVDESGEGPGARAGSGKGTCDSGADHDDEVDDVNEVAGKVVDANESRAEANKSQTRKKKPSSTASTAVDDNDDKTTNGNVGTDQDLEADPEGHDEVVAEDEGDSTVKSRGAARPKARRRSGLLHELQLQPHELGGVLQESHATMGRNPRAAAVAALSKLAVKPADSNRDKDKEKEKEREKSATEVPVAAGRKRVVGAQCSLQQLQKLRAAEVNTGPSFARAPYPWVACDKCEKWRRLPKVG